MHKNIKILNLRLRPHELGFFFQCPDAKDFYGFSRVKENHDALKQYYQM
jgi:hypothetical protein